jgi:nucleoside phosphorylase
MPNRASSTFDIAVVCALHAPELQKVLQTGDWVSLENDPSDPTEYHHTIYTTDKGTPIHVVAAAASQMGMPESATLATKMILKFSPKLVAMIGIAAGARQKDQGFGDILCADKTFDYNAGKVENIKRELRFAPDSEPLPVTSRIKNRLLHWKHSKTDELARISAKWATKKPMTRLSLQVGPIASGSAVINARQPVEEVINRWRKLIGLEMEAYGVHVACERTTDPRVMFLCAKAICDFATKKGDHWQDYAAFTAAEFFHRFIAVEWETISDSRAFLHHERVFRTELVENDRDLNSLYCDFQRVFGEGILALSTLREIHEKAPCVWRVTCSDLSVETPVQDTVGFFEIFPLTPAAAEALVAGLLQTRALQLRHVSDPKACEHFYIASIGIVPQVESNLRRVMSAGTEHCLLDFVSGLNAGRGITLYARPATEDGLRLVEGFKFEKKNPAVADEDSIWAIKLDPRATARSRWKNVSSVSKST